MTASEAAGRTALTEQSNKCKQVSPSMKQRRSAQAADDDPPACDGAKNGPNRDDNGSDYEQDENALDPALLKEEQAARQAREKAAKQKPKEDLTKEKLEKLDKLVEQATMYSEFLVEQVNSVKDQWEQPEDSASPGSKRKKNGASGSGGGKKAKTEVKPTQRLVPSIEGDLREYQLKGVAWLISLWTNGMNGILADQMGLGKTIQTVAFLSHLRDHGIMGPFLVVAPLSTIHNWRSEVKKWCPSMDAIVYHGTKQERQALGRKWFQAKFNTECPEEFPVIVTTYEIAIRDRKEIARLRYKYLVVDEGHRLKNSECLLIRELKQISAENKLLLTGTPLQNNLAELWSLLNFLLPQVFNNLKDFESWFDFSNIVSSDGQENTAASKDIMEQEAKSKMVSKLHNILKPFLLRRVKADVEQSLPAKQEIILYAPLTKTQKKLQDDIANRKLVEEMAATAKANNVNSANVQKLHSMLMQLRKNSNHPDLITGEYDQSSTYPPADELCEQAGKLQLLERLLRKLHAGGHKVLIFSQFTKMLDLLDAYLEERGHTARRIDGTVGHLERQQYMNEFNSDPDCFVFLLSTRAGGLGINLTSADTVIIYDSDWNPHQDMQAMDRAHRIGQTKPVLVLRFCTSDSVEVKLLRRAHSKLALERLVIKKGAFEGKGGAAADDKDKDTSLNAADLLDVLKGGLRLDKGAAQNSTVSDDMLAQLLDRSHLAAKTAAPYDNTGPGYELVEAQTAGLLNSVNN